MAAEFEANKLFLGLEGYANAQLVICGDADHARKLFDKILHPDFYSWKVMLRRYTPNERCSKAIRFFVDMKCYVVCSLILKACIKLVDIESGMKLHCYITEVEIPIVSC